MLYGQRWLFSWAATETDMPSARRYAYLNARVSVLGERLRTANTISLLESEQQTQQALQHAGLDVRLASEPSALEIQALELLVAEAALLVRSLVGPQRAMLRHWVRRFELMNLKVLIRAKLSARNRKDMLEQLLDMGPLTDLPVEDLLHVEDLPELLRRLESTPYSNMARHARRSFDERRDLFGVEAALERQYFSGLAERLHALPRADRTRLRGFITTMLDQVNLVWLLRYRFAYGLEPPQTFFLLTPFGSGLGGALLQLVQFDNMKDVLEHLPPELRSRLEGVRSVREVEDRMAERTSEAAWSLMRNAMFDLSRVFAYLYLREQQLHRLYMLCKGRKLQLSTDLIREAVGLDAVSTATTG